MDRESRRITNSTQASIREIDYYPSYSGVPDGELVISAPKNKPLRLYKKLNGILWKTDFSSDGNQYVDRDINIAGNINLSNKLIIKNYPAFGTMQSASADNQEIESGAHETIVFDEKLYDNGGDFSISNYSFTAPINGIYHFNARIFWDADASAADGDWAAEDYHQINLVKNDRTSVPAGAEFVALDRRTIQGTVTDVYLSNNVISDLKLDAGDYISVAAKHVTAAGHSQYTYAPTTTYAWTSFTGHLVTAI